MPLTLITGRANSGKTGRALARFREALAAGRSPKLIVPSQPDVERVSDEGLREHYRTCRALVYPVDEDFGIVMAEAQACGAPVIGLARGGALDIVEPGVTGWLIETQRAEELRGAVERAAREDLDRDAIVANSERFSADRFRAEVRALVEECVARSRSRC